MCVPHIHGSSTVHVHMCTHVLCMYCKVVYKSTCINPYTGRLLIRTLYFLRFITVRPTLAYFVDQPLLVLVFPYFVHLLFQRHGEN